MPAAGFTPAISACSTSTATSSSRTAPRTSSFPAARTSPPSRSRTSSTSTRPCCSRPWSQNPIPKWGEVPCAFVELKEGAKATEADIIAFCRSHMSGFKTPKAVVFGADPEDVHRQDPEIPAAQPGGFGEGDFGVDGRHGVSGSRSASVQSAACPPSSAKSTHDGGHGACAPLPTLRHLLASTGG